MQFSMRNSKREFANHFVKNHTIVFLQISTIGSLISEKWKLSSFEFVIVLTHHSSSKKWTQNCLAFIYCNFTPICAELRKSYGMDFGKMVCKFHFWIPCASLHYPSNFQVYITTRSTKTGTLYSQNHNN